MFFFRFFFTKVITRYWIQFPMLYSRSLFIFYIVVVSVNPKLLVYPYTLLSPLVGVRIFFSMSVSLWFVNKFIWIIFLDSTCEWYHMIFVSVWLASLSMIISKSIHVTAMALFHSFCGWVILEGDQSCKELTHWKRPWCWEALWAGGEGGDRGWDG